MIVRKLRLQRAWSQEHLALLTGLSIRTIQRIERGQVPSLESLKSLASVFEIPLHELQPENNMDNNKQENSSQAKNVNNSANLTEEEKSVLEQVRDIKGFYSHLINYCIVISFLFVVNYITSPSYIWAWWAAMGWGIGVISHGLSVFEVFNFFGADWEKKQVEKRLGRKL